MSNFKESRSQRHQRLRQKEKRKRTSKLRWLNRILALGVCAAAVLFFTTGTFKQMFWNENSHAQPPAPNKQQHSSEQPHRDQQQGESNNVPNDNPTDSNDTHPITHEPINIIFAGDALMDWSVKETIRSKGPDYPFKYVAPAVTKADYAVVNLETAVTTHDQKDPNQLYNFKSDPISLKGIKNAGFDLVTIANNHALDFKQKGFLDTLNHLQDYQLPYVGGGKNAEEAYRAHEVTLKGKKIKFLAFSRFIPQTYWFAGPDHPGIAEAYNKSSVLPVIERERKDCDYLLVYMHWGVEKKNRPEPWQRTYAREIIDAGADAIVSSHVHVLQGFEYYKGKPIAYSIGNFLFPDYVRNDKADTGLLTLTLQDGEIAMQFDPYFIYKDQIIKKEPSYDKKQLHYLESISYDVTIDGKQVKDAVKVNQHP
ncbi:CapA family protein [Paenibacillus sp. 481]|uniref:CapA family protein n=1 Tax=Paenibacillus sp. 481 TaxID=2835869 RepID=UPI001E2EF289|nr:CapA family protein [Paenibacillus sp. 481]UHA72823.1 CapA family protein [Paenibacillus sp. 481]